MATGTSPRTTRPGQNSLLRALRSALIAAFLVATWVIAPAADAHDQLLASSPADGEVVSKPPTEVLLEFDAELVGISPVIEVRDAAGVVVAGGSPQADGAQVRLALPVLEDGAYTVAWRVVAADGHPIVGDLTFGVARLTEPSPSPTPRTEAPGVPSATATLAPDLGAPPSGGTAAGWPAWVVAGAVAAAVAVGLAVRRRRTP